MLSPQIRKAIDKSVLCWLATCSADGQPNVSPKNTFTYYETDNVIIANIASPQSVMNIKANPRVCVSFIDVLVQKGFKLTGQAEIFNKSAPIFEQLAKPLLKMAGNSFPFGEIISIKINLADPIIAPSYLFYPETTTEDSQIEKAKKAYGL